MTYGLWDTTGNCWLGNESGPLSYTEWDMARAAATVASEQLGYRIRPVAITHGPWRHKDTVKTKMTALEAIQKIEGKCDL